MGLEIKSPVCTVAKNSCSKFVQMRTVEASCEKSMCVTEQWRDGVSITLNRSYFLVVCKYTRPSLLPTASISPSPGLYLMSVMVCLARRSSRMISNVLASKIMIAPKKKE